MSGAVEHVVGSEGRGVALQAQALAAGLAGEGAVC